MLGSYPGLASPNHPNFWKINSIQQISSQLSFPLISLDFFFYFLVGFCRPYFRFKMTFISSLSTPLQTTWNSLPLDLKWLSVRPLCYLFVQRHYAVRTFHRQLVLLMPFIEQYHYVIYRPWNHDDVFYFETTGCQLRYL